MKNVVDFPDRRTVAEEAAQWLILLDRDERPSAADLANLREWLKRSAAHREELNTLAEIWGKMNVLTELAVPLGRPKFGTSAITGIAYLLFQRWTFATLGFSVLAIVAMSVLIIGRPTSLFETNGYYSTAVGQQVTTTLADGSTIILNTNTQVKVEYNESTRSVQLLQGEAYFTVAHVEDMPFRVYAGGGRIQAVGTAFTVRIKGDDVDVTVTEGKVELASVNQRPQANEAGVQGGSIAATYDETAQDIGTLSAGQIGTILRDWATEVDFASSIQEIEAPDIQRRLSWREGLLTFSGEPLEVVVDEISRYTTVKIEIADPDVRSIRIGGRFPVGETTAMLRSLEENFGLRVTRIDQDHVLLSSVAQ